MRSTVRYIYRSTGRYIYWPETMRHIRCFRPALPYTLPSPRSPVYAPFAPLSRIPTHPPHPTPGRCCFHARVLTRAHTHTLTRLVRNERYGTREATELTVLFSCARARARTRTPGQWAPIFASPRVNEGDPRGEKELWSMIFEKVCVCVRACLRACVRACVIARVCARP